MCHRRIAEREKRERLWRPRGHDQVVSFSRKMARVAAENRDYCCTCEEDSEAYDPNVPSWLCRHRDCFATEIGACEEKRCREPRPGTCDCMFGAFLPRGNHPVARVPRFRSFEYTLKLRNTMTTCDPLCKQGSSTSITHLSFARPLAGRLRPTKQATRRRMLPTACPSHHTCGPPTARPLADTSLPSRQASREPARTRPL